MQQKTRKWPDHDGPGVRSLAMTLPPLTPQGFWTRLVVFGAGLLVYLWAVLMMIQEHSPIGVVLLYVLALLSLTRLIVTVSRRPR
jgi:hypothetical protein